MKINKLFIHFGRRYSFTVTVNLPGVQTYLGTPSIEIGGFCRILSILSGFCYFFRFVLCICECYNGSSVKTQMRASPLTSYNPYICFKFSRLSLNRERLVSSQIIKAVWCTHRNNDKNPHFFHLLAIIPPRSGNLRPPF